MEAPAAAFHKNCVFLKAFCFLISLAAEAVVSWWSHMDLFAFQGRFPVAKRLSLSVWLRRYICFLQTAQVANGQLNENHASHLWGLAVLISPPNSYLSLLTYALLMATGRRHPFHAMMSLCCLPQQLASLSCTLKRNNDKIVEESSLGRYPGEPRLPHHIPQNMKRTALPGPSGRYHRD